MKLSEAIRLGSMASDQVSGEFWQDGRTCAQGAALLAIGRLDTIIGTKNHHHMREAWPWISTMAVPCPVALCPAHRHVSSVQVLLPHLNNDLPWGHGWAREAIADWIATLEPAGSVDAIAPPAIVTYEP